jgi:hypothetical protein
VLDHEFLPYGNPAEGVAVRIAPVEDGRVFRTGPLDRPAPSLVDPAHLDDPAVTSRVVGGWWDRRTGMPEGELVLPAGRTVQVVVEELLVRAFQEADYRVLFPGDPDFANARPVRATIVELWLADEGPDRVFRARLTIPRLPGPAAEGVEIVVSAHVDRHGAPGRSGWQRLFSGGLERLQAETRRQVDPRLVHGRAPAP